MCAKGLVLLLAALALALSARPGAAQQACAAPQPVCAARAAVFAVSSAFDPLASAVLVAPGVLVTNRHVVADETRIEVRLDGGGRLAGEVVPTAYPGDLVLIAVPGLEGDPLSPGEAGDGPLFTIGANEPGGDIRVYAPGRVIARPAAGRPLARLHHSAYGQPGNSGGAPVDGDRRLVAIVTAGGEGRNDAIPAVRLVALRAASGPGHGAASRALGRAYRACIEGLERPAPDALDALIAACEASGNRQLFDLAGQALGRTGRTGDSARLFRAALERDPNSVNSMVGLAVTLHLAERWNEEVAVLGELIERIPEDFQALRMSVQAGKFAGAETLVERALALIERHHPDALDAANEFLAQ